jgi:C1A family cysteine protease
MSRHYGWNPDKPDYRDKRYKSIKPKLKKADLPSSVSLREKMPPIIDQGELGSCTACCISTALMYNRMITNATPKFRPSRLFIYYNERVVEKTIYYDSGAEIRTGIKSVNKIGFCDEKFWRYNPAIFKRRPSKDAYRNAGMYKSHEYFRLDNTKIDDLKTCLASGFPFVFGFTVYSNIVESDTNGGYILMPGQDDSADGGHAVLCTGYDDTKKCFEIHNSWGTKVGDKGYNYLPYDYMTNDDLSDDFWTIRSINETDNM